MVNMIYQLPFPQGTLLPYELEPLIGAQAGPTFEWLLDFNGEERERNELSWLLPVIHLLIITKLFSLLAVAVL